MTTATAIELGASLYLPATRPDLAAVGNGQRYPFLRSVIFCTEDSIRADELPAALANLEANLPRLFDRGPLRFIRLRNPAVLENLLGMPGIDRIIGFVLPKITAESLADYSRRLPSDNRFLLMPTLETREVFDHAALAELRACLADAAIRPRILALRIGGSDLLNLLGIRRSPTRTLYETALGPLIATLVAAFRPFGFPLTAPVFEGLEWAHEPVLREEVRRDLEFGLLGKSAIHPRQVPVIEAEYRVPPADIAMAERILAADAPGVFQFNGVMCEPATHAVWARTILERARIFGRVPRLAAVAGSLPLG